nr:GRIP and coiled-coil domain-containing protein 1-like isoform X1 [Procambarus clarkii]XP_045625687.1 GRIP and coiled-coil domain-containing protein 1-like isoform X1 [Procambarus clarkii]XP_045625688.1 GRIP and coiled-coil domain-containing protein 1-like isoform X1 [Procambarus clarkii]
MASKRDLITTVERQKEQISKYETKLKDVVRAYKGLLKEKEALEVSLSALADTQIQKSVAEKPEGSEKEIHPQDGEEPTGDHSKRDVKDTEEQANPTEVTEDLKKKLVALTSALNILSSEKRRIELSFQNDKKRLLSEKEKLERSLQETLDARKANEINNEEKIQDLRSRLIIAQHERDQDTQNSAVMLRELESKLAVERSARERMEASLDEAKQQLQRPTPPIDQRPQELYEKKISDLQNELEQVRSRLKRAEQQSEEPPILRKIQGQMEEMRTQHNQALQQELCRAAAVEESARDLAKCHEERVVALEARLSDLSVTVASYDRTRQEDLHAIQKLKEKVSELAQENTYLASRLEQDTDNSETDVNALCRRLTKLRDQLINANFHSSHPVDVESMSLLYGGENIHSRCQQEYDHLKEEFENYKISSKQQSKAVKEPSCKGDCGKQIEELRQKIRNLTSAAQLAADSHSQQVASLRQELSSLRTSHDNQLRRAESESRAVVAAVEQQLSMQQQRSLATLSERDLEIQRLTQQLHERNKSPPQNGVGSLEATAALLSQVSGGSEGPLLHHLEELARKHQEISQLRREKRQLETTMREVQMAALVRQQAHQDAIEALEEKVERHRRNVSREGENLEYLKNVVLQYMMSSDAESRQLMLNAISIILKFTSSEVESVKAYNALWWWQPAPKNTVPHKPTY